MSHWVTQTQQLDTLAQGLDQGPIALDTEFIRERTYYPKLALVQLRAAHGEECLIDPLALPDAGGLAEVLQGDTLKIMHSPGEDLQAFQHGWNVNVGPIFDTQQAAALAGHGAGKGYQALVADLLGIELEKGETRSDWMRRPLSDSQCHYAAEDVRHLHALHEALERRLRELGRLEWLTEDCERLVANANDSSLDPHPHLTSRSAQRMKPEAQARLRRLLLWRDATARQLDRPRSWILDNELVVLLAQEPMTPHRFHALLDRHPRAPRRLREPLWEEVSRPLDSDELSIPLAAAPDPAQRNTLKAMQAVVAQQAHTLDLPEGVLCARRHLETLLSTRQWPDALDGWRATLLRQPLMELLP